MCEITLESVRRSSSREGRRVKILQLQTEGQMLWRKDTQMDSGCG